MINAVFSWSRNGKSCVLSCLFWSALGELYLLVSYYNLPNLDYGQNMLPSKHSITFNLVESSNFPQKEVARRRLPLFILEQKINCNYEKCLLCQIGRSPPGHNSFYPPEHQLCQRSPKDWLYWCQICLLSEILAR